MMHSVFRKPSQLLRQAVTATGLWFVCASSASGSSASGSSESYVANDHAWSVEAHVLADHLLRQQQQISAPNACEGASEGDCLAESDCAWCSSAAVGDACYTQVRQRHLLYLIFLGCLGRSPLCLCTTHCRNGCHSDAVATSHAAKLTVIQEDAAKLPAAIFSCKTASLAAAGGAVRDWSIRPQ